MSKSTRTCTTLWGGLLAGVLWAGGAAAQPLCAQTNTPAEPPPGACDPAPPSLGIAGEPEAPYSCAEARVIFVDFPVWMPAPTEQPQNNQGGGVIINPGVQGAFNDALSAAISAVVDEDWFCAQDACGDPCRAKIGGGINVEVTPVLSLRNVPGRRADGHRRFWRVRFSGQGGAQDPYLPVMGSQQCEAVSQVRQAVEQLAPSYGLTAAEAGYVKVGREACNVQPMGQASEWHLDYTGAGPAGAVPAPPANELPQIALIDTGVANAQVPTNDVVSRHPEPAVGGINEHGDAMVGFIRQMVPAGAAEIFSWQVMDGEGVGVTAYTGIALDEALYDLDPSRPLILNMSLGWLPEYERVRALRGPGCVVEEDGVGEVVRYMLTVAKEADSAARPVVAVSAAGNRPLNGERVDVHKVEFNSPYDECTEGWWIGEPRPPMLFPSEFSRTRVEGNGQLGCVEGEALTLAVGAINPRGKPTGVSIPRALAEPYLVAPGAHVHAPQGAVPSGANVYTGTSVSAALTSGAVARALAFLGVARANEPLLPRLSGAQITDLLYLTGYDLKRYTWPGDPVRSLHVGAADAFVNCGELFDAVACVAQDEGTQIINRCGELLEICGAQPGNPPGYDPEGRRPVPSCELPVSNQGADACIDWKECPNDGDVRFGPPQLANEPPDRLRRDALGAVGPQPHLPSCPDCSLFEFFPYVHVSITWSSLYDPVKTRFTSPYLLLTDKYGKQSYVALESPSNAAGYLPGDSAYFKYVQVPKALVNVEKAQLVTTILQSGKVSAVDTSALQLK